jgi:hypothetical protein
MAQHNSSTQLEIIPCWMDGWMDAGMGWIFFFTSSSTFDIFSTANWLAD